MKVSVLGTKYEAKNEEVVDWIAIQFEKMLGAFIETKCIDSIGVDINIYDRQSNNPINDPINSPKVKEAKATIKIPELRLPTDDELIKHINETMQARMIGGVKQ